VNKVFLTGTVKRTPKVVYTPKGKKILMFPLQIQDGSFMVDVLFSGERHPSDLERVAGGEILVAGALTRTRTGAEDVFKIESSQILWMEE
jgi:primosomal replication protein N